MNFHKISSGLKKIKSNKKGNTLVEIILYLSIITVFFTSMIGFTVSVVQSGQKARTMHEVSQNGRFIMEKIAREIKSANDVNYMASTFGTNPGVLSLVNNTGSLDPTVFDVLGGVVRITQGAGAPMNISSDLVNVTNLVFTDLSVPGRTTNIRIDLTLEWRDKTMVLTNTSTSMQTSVVVR